MNDTIADMLTRLRNAASAKHKTVDVKNSNICQGIAKVLKEEQKRTGIKLLWGTANAFSHPRYAHGASTSPASRTGYPIRRSR